VDATKQDKVLIVDDDDSNLMLLTHILDPEYTVYTAKNGGEAIRAAEKYLPDVILLDIIMPEQDGYTVISSLKSSEKTRGIPVIFITGLSNTDSEAKGFAFGASDYISKPFSPEVVKFRVRNQKKMLDQLRTIEQLSLTDQLTNLPNRRSFEIRLQSEWARARREQTPLSICMLDVDKFKNYNDTYGHQQGDIALRAVAENLAQTLKRPGDFAARWGGEELVVLLPNTNSRGACVLAEQIRRRVEGMDIPCPGRGQTKLTVSIGVHTQVPEHSVVSSEFILEADAALYAAKSREGNKVCN